MIELAASEVSYGPVDGSVFAFTPPAEREGRRSQAAPSTHDTSSRRRHRRRDKPKVTTHGHGITGASPCSKARPSPARRPASLPEGLPKVKINGATTASELPTALGTLLSFERSGVRYLLAGAVTPARIEAVARGL